MCAGLPTGASVGRSVNVGGEPGLHPGEQSLRGEEGARGTGVRPPYLRSWERGSASPRARQAGGPGPVKKGEGGLLQVPWSTPCPHSANSII